MGISFRVVVLGALAVWNGMLSPARAQEGLFADKNLEREVRLQVSRRLNPGEPLSLADLAQISALSARAKGIRNLSGIENCKGLRRLDLAENEIENLTLLKGLTRLESLDLSGTRIDDLTPLAALQQLEYLDLSGNRISDIGSLAALTRLNLLDLADNQIADVDPLVNLRMLWSLNVSRNRIADISPLGRLRNLSSLDLDNNLVRDLSALRPLSGLRNLSAEANEITDLSPLLEMVSEDGSPSLGVARFWSISLRGNPLKPSTREQLEKLRKHTLSLDVAGPDPLGQTAVRPVSGS